MAERPRTGPHSDAIQARHKWPLPTFQGLNPDLYVLPQHILCDEAAINELLATISSAQMPLEHKVGLIETHELHESNGNKDVTHCRRRLRHVKCGFTLTQHVQHGRNMRLVK